MLYVAASGLELSDLLGIDIKSNAMKPRICKRADERQPNVSKADDTDFCRLVSNLRGKLRSQFFSCRSEHESLIPEIELVCSSTLQSRDKSGNVTRVAFGSLRTGVEIRV
jgi:hypothetical protein